MHQHLPEAGTEDHTEDTLVTKACGNPQMTTPTSRLNSTSPYKPLLTEPQAHLATLSPGHHDSGQSCSHSPHVDLSHSFFCRMSFSPTKL